MAGWKFEIVGWVQMCSAPPDWHDGGHGSNSCVPCGVRQWQVTGEYVLAKPPGDRGRVLGWGCILPGDP